MGAKKLRHVKSIVQHVFVLDDGSNLEEVSTEPIAVSAEHWPTYSSEGFKELIKNIEEARRAPKESQDSKKSTKKGNEKKPTAKKTPR